MGCGGVGETVKGWWEELKKQQWMEGERGRCGVWEVARVKVRDGGIQSS